VTPTRFGISTHLVHEQALTRDALAAIADHGFEAIELFATRSHFDYHDAAAIDALAGWLAETRLRLHSMHAPIVEALRHGQWVSPFSNASSDETRRRAAVAETGTALGVARRIPFDYLVLHLGVPDANASPSDNSASAARRSVEQIAELARPLGVRVALELIPNALSGAAELSAFIEDTLEDFDIGACLDYGHGHLGGDLGDAIETLSGHIWTTHVHDNNGQRDEHLMPFAGSIDWDAAMMTTQKVGYDGVLMFEVAGTGDTGESLRRAARARERLEQLLVVF
jgi:sugar phosphate isomerase/epimerase